MALRRESGGSENGWEGGWEDGFVNRIWLFVEWSGRWSGRWGFEGGLEVAWGVFRGRVGGCLGVDWGSQNVFWESLGYFLKIFHIF